ncbi:hypothetical protein I3271_07400 [Photobacterium leiognathi]|uniref:hypothetical protein n=1 Tax=Photobacterium leiognathi TaxID=553611 RepID=UPI001EDDC55F|nr:hypothetical protein [Photobacterium leiognathi]MCG3884511.1 hypothetical protein [Photobacterium leiognathi]
MKLKALKSVLIWMIACSPLAIFLACVVSNASYAEDFDLRNSKTIQNLTIAADEGDEVAAYRLGHYFESKHDIVNAVYWYKESAYGAKPYR